MFDSDVIEAGHSTCLFFVRRFEESLLLELLLDGMLLEFGRCR
jgi:hypothetical protein